MGNRDLLLKAQKVRNHEDWWWYELPKGICVVMQVKTGPNDFIYTKEKLIPWARIRAALARKDVVDNESGAETD